jgi:F420-dependent oxidoreductase-like protein
MRVGVHLGAWSRGYGPRDQLALARAAEDRGYESVWVSENYGSDAASVLGWLAAQTDRVRIGSAVLQLAGRTPALTAMTAATVDGLSGGRFILGIGVSSSQVVEGWHGQEFDRPVRRLREYVEIVRLALAREPLDYDGELYRVARPGGAGKPLKLVIEPVQERLPIYLGTFAPQATALAAEIADGWIPFLYWPERADMFRQWLLLGAARAGRALSELAVAPLVEAAVGADLEQCRARLRPILAFYVGGAGSREQNPYANLVRRYGYDDVVDQLQELFLSGRRDEAVSAVPDEMLDALTLCGPPERVAERLGAFAEAGVDTVLVSPAGATLPERLETVNALAPLAERLRG